MAIRSPMMVPTTPPRMMRSENRRMICSIWMTMTAAIKPNKRPIMDNWYEARYFRAIKYPLIEQMPISSERISKRTFPLSFRIGVTGFQRTRHREDVKKLTGKRLSRPQHTVPGQPEPGDSASQSFHGNAAGSAVAHCSGNMALISASTLASAARLAMEISLMSRCFAVSIIFLSPKDRSLPCLRMKRSRRTLAIS